MAASILLAVALLVALFLPMTHRWVVGAWLVVTIVQIVRGMRKAEVPRSSTEVLGSSGVPAEELRGTEEPRGTERVPAPSETATEAVAAPLAPPEPAKPAVKETEATILISDLRDFTAYAESESPANVVRFLGDLRVVLAGIVRDERGVVDQFVGDGMVAVFGTSKRKRDHARAAVDAARRMLSNVEALGRHLGREIRLGIGIHTGPVIIGRMTGADHADHEETLGDTVHTAAQLEKLTKEHQVPLLMTEETVLRLGSTERVAAVGEVEVREQHTVRIYTLA